MPLRVSPAAEKETFPVCRICVTSVILAELVFTQLSHTGGSTDPGQASPLHSCLCPLFFPRGTWCANTIWYQCAGPHHHPAWTTPGLQLSGRLTGCTENKHLSAHLFFSELCFWYESLVWLYSSQGLVVGDGCTWQFGMATTLEFFIVSSCPRRSHSAPAAARWLLFLCCPNPNMCSSQSATVKQKLPADSTAFPCVCGRFSPVSGRQLPRDTLFRGLHVQYTAYS